MNSESSVALSINRHFDLQDGDVIYNDAEEEINSKANITTIPSKLKAVIKFAYEDGMKAALKGEDFNSWIEDVLCHTQAFYRHPSLGTTIEFEVCKIIKKKL